MTENEAINELQSNIDLPFGFTVSDEVSEIAIQALEEIQQYRAIGLTPELIEAMQGHNVALINDLGEYQAIGTIEEFNVLKEKNEPKKPKKHPADSRLTYCPCCGSYHGAIECYNYCPECGQKLDWQ